MIKVLRTAAVALGLLTAAIAPALSLSITFDEAGNCTGCTSEQFTTDPTGNFGGNVLIYGLPETVGTGPVNILDLNGSISDTLLFTSTQLIVYSYDNGGLLADVGPTVLFPNAVTGPTEDANGQFIYVSGSNTYHGVSGVSSVPLPGALPLFATGLVALGFLNRRRKRNSSAGYLSK